MPSSSNGRQGGTCAEMLRSAQLREEIVGRALGDVGHCVAPEVASLPPRERGQVTAGDDDPARRRRVVTRDQAKQRRLAAAGDADDGGDRPGRDLRVDLRKRIHDAARGERSACVAASSTISGSADTELLPDTGPAHEEREDRADQAGDAMTATPEPIRSGHGTWVTGAGEYCESGSTCPTIAPAVTTRRGETDCGRDPDEEVDSSATDEACLAA